MTIRFLLDTNIVAEPIKRKPNNAIVRRLKLYEVECAIPSVVWYELVLGYSELPSSARRSAIEQYVHRLDLHVLPYDQEAALWHASEHARLAGIGKTPPLLDGQIASIAATKGLTLVTLNQRDFRQFADLKLESWSK